MILVDIYVPAIDREYNFSLNEGMTAKTIIEEVAEMIGQKERTALNGDHSDMLLCSRDLQEIIPLESTLEESNITTGASLLLV